ncbi:MAG TPA: hybrid sensor histidine kinase/response regulator [Myxococcales bacterium]|nr:hybrid sensor histidine kinase/response regulator [Myxococcales bacterium]
MTITHGEHDRLQELVHDLQVHQVELEMQNRELRETQALLEESRGRYADLYDFAPVAYCTVDFAGTLREINLSGAALLGAQRRFLIGKPFFRNARTDEAGFLHLLGRCRTEKATVMAELLLAPRGRSPIAVQATCNQVDDGNLKTVRMALVDITERKRAEDERAALLTREQAARAEAEVANRDKDEFLATLSHELRTPLAALLMWLSVARSAQAQSSDFGRALDAIELSARAQLRLIQDLVEVSRLRHTRPRLSFSDVETAGAIESVVNLLRPSAHAKAIAVKLRFEDRSLRTLADPDRLRQMIGNLLANSIEFTPNGGTIAVRLSRAGDHVRIEVSDDGEGIAADFLPHVFEPFRRGPHSAKTGHGGLGLGLSIVAELTRLHGGRVRAYSAGEGRGALFTIDLPLVSEEARKEAARTPARGPPAVPVARIEGVHVLVVEDDPKSREAVTAMLSLAGARVTAVESAAAALAAIAREQPDVLLSDLAMPGEDGIALLGRIRALPRDAGGAVPAAAMTAAESDDVRDRALAAGFSCSLVKPLDPEHLISVMGALALRKGHGRKPQRSKS